MRVVDLLAPAPAPAPAPAAVSVSTGALDSSTALSAITAAADGLTSPTLASASLLWLPSMATYVRLRWGDELAIVVVLWWYQLTFEFSFFFENVVWMHSLVCNSQLKLHNKLQHVFQGRCFSACSCISSATAAGFYWSYAVSQDLVAVSTYYTSCAQLLASLWVTVCLRWGAPRSAQSTACQSPSLCMMLMLHSCCCNTGATTEPNHSIL